MLLRNHHAALVGAAFDVLSGDSNIHLVDVVLGHIGGVGHGTADGVCCAAYVFHYATFNTHGLSLAESDYAYLSFLGPLANEAGNLGGSNVKSYDVFVHIALILLFSTIIGLLFP